MRDRHQDHVMVPAWPGADPRSGPGPAHRSISRGRVPPRPTYARLIRLTERGRPLERHVIAASARLRLAGGSIRARSVPGTRGRHRGISPRAPTRGQMSPTYDADPAVAFMK